MSRQAQGIIQPTSPFTFVRPEARGFMGLLLLCGLRVMTLQLAIPPTLTHLLVPLLPGGPDQYFQGRGQAVI